MKKIKLGEVCKFIDYRGKTPQKTANGIPLITAQIIKDGFIQEPQEFIAPELYNEHMRRGIPKKGDVVLTTEAPLGEVAQIKTDEKLAFAQRVIILQADEKILNKTYLLYALQYKPFKDRILGKASGTTVFGIRASELKEVQIEVPSLETQKKIAALLGALDDKIALNKKINATLEAMAKTLYDYWFVQFDFPDENGKPYKTSGGKMIYSSELGRDIPDGWEVVSLKGKISISRGISYSTETLSANEEGVPMINLASVDRKRNYIPNSLKFFARNVPNEKKLQAMDMLIACTDLTRQAEIIGSPILVMNDREYTFSMDLAKLTVTDEKLNELYLYMNLRTNFYHQYIIGFASGTTVLHLNTNGIEWYKVLIPPTVLQKKFAEVMNNIYLQTCKNICESQRLAELRDWLLPMLMNGQIKFKEM